jgi:hypothetical protein
MVAPVRDRLEPHELRLTVESIGPKPYDRTSDIQSVFRTHAAHEGRGSGDGTGD